MLGTLYINIAVELININFNTFYLLFHMQQKYKYL